MRKYFKTFKTLKNVTRAIINCRCNNCCDYRTRGGHHILTKLKVLNPRFTCSITSRFVVQLNKSTQKIEQAEFRLQRTDATDFHPDRIF